MKKPPPITPQEREEITERLATRKYPEPFFYGVWIKGTSLFVKRQPWSDFEHLKWQKAAELVGVRKEPDGGKGNDLRGSSHPVLQPEGRGIS